VTSRSGLAGLVSRDGAVRLRLGLLPNEDALTLLRHAVGADRMDDEPDQAQRLARLCAHLPLALRIAGERVAGDEHGSLGDIVGDLNGERDRLDALASDGALDETTAVRSVFSWSYRGLTPEAARLFRYLGLHPGAHFSTNAAAALLDRPPAQARTRLRQLADAHLVESVSRGRYGFHDLLSAYAAERAEIDERADDRLAAVRRLLHWYLHTADLADRALLPLHRRFPLGLPAPPHGVVEFSTREEALDWCEAERPSLVAVVRQAAELGEHVVAAHFPRALWSFFDLRKPWTEWVEIYRIGLASARACDDKDNEAWILSGLAVARYDLEDFDETIRLGLESIAIRRVIDDRWGEAGTLSILGLAYRRLRRYDLALDCLGRSLALRLETGDRRGEAGTLNRLGATYRDLGRFEESLDHLYRSLAIRKDIGDHHGIGFALHSIGATLDDLGRFDEAIGCYRGSLQARLAVGDRHGCAANLYCLGKLLDKVNRPVEARAVMEQALTIFVELGAPQAAEVRHHLATRND
jgi:tetratricopeptide (TPR) repeat protein